MSEDQRVFALLASLALIGGVGTYLFLKTAFGPWIEDLERRKRELERRQRQQDVQKPSGS